MYIVTGGGSGIGRALAIALAKRQQTVLICGRRKDCLAETQSFAPELIEVVCGDLRQPEVRAAIEEKVAGRKLSGLVQNAAQLTPIVSIVDMDIAEFNAHIATNLEAPLVLFKQLHQYLSNGKVLHLSSFMAHHAAHSWGAYCISKAGLHMLWQVLQKECPDIAFGSVMPGVTDTNMQSLIRDASALPADDQAYFQSLHDNNKLLSTDTVAQFLTWLLLDVAHGKFSQKEWDIYDNQHHNHWLKDGMVEGI